MKINNLKADQERPNITSIIVGYDNDTKRGIQKGAVLTLDPVEGTNEHKLGIEFINATGADMDTFFMGMFQLSCQALNITTEVVGDTVDDFAQVEGFQKPCDDDTCNCEDIEACHACTRFGENFVTCEERDNITCNITGDYCTNCADRSRDAE